MKKISTTVLLCSLSLGIVISDAKAQTHSLTQRYSSNIQGQIGLNTVPSARMDKTGTLRTQLGFLDPYAHAFIGMQIADPLYIGIRQTGEFSNFTEDAERLYPGIDAKLRLAKETKTRPALAFGIQSGTGHKRMSGEYLTFSKRYKSFDFTGGIGWGRYASAAHIDNPLKALGKHFGKNRDLDGENPVKPSQWFTGKHLGFFGGVEYFTPVKGLSLKADIGGDRYTAEQAAFDFDPPAPWSIGMNYKPWNFIDLSLAAQGTDKIMGRVSLQGNVKNWRHQSTSNNRTINLRPYRTDLALPAEMQQSAAKNNLHLNYIHTTPKTATAFLTLSPHHSAPKQIGQAVVHIANHAGSTIEKIQIEPLSYGLRGPNIQIMRSSIENALAHNNGSPAEIWHTSEITHTFKGLQKLRSAPPAPKSLFTEKLSFQLDNQLSLSEEEIGMLRRSSLLIEAKRLQVFHNLTAGLGLRLNLSDNLGKLKRVTIPTTNPIRGDVYDFADRRVALDTAYLAMTHTLAPNIHASIITGYLDEMFAGFGGELLYRPYDKRFAIGVESWTSAKRSPYEHLNLEIKERTYVVTGFLNAWYDIPNADTTLHLKAGRYLATDYGIGLTLSKTFKNGATMEGYVMLSNQSDPDLLGGATHTDHGLKLSLPLGGFTHTPRTKVNVLAAPFGRDLGQSIQNPLPLYEATEPFNLSHIAQHWDEFTQ